MSRSLVEILNDMAQYAESTHVVKVDEQMSTVEMINRVTQECEVFLETHSADEFIEMATQDWEAARDIGMETAYYANAKPYIDCI